MCRETQRRSCLMNEKQTLNVFMFLRIILAT